MTPDPDSATDSPPIPAGFLGWLPWAAAAVAALLAGFLIELYFAARMEIAILNDQMALGRVENLGLQQRLEAERILSARRIAALTVDTRDLYDLSQCNLVRLEPPAGGGGTAAAVVVWDARRQRGTLLARQLPPAPPGREYRLWILDSRQPAPLDAGRLAGDGGGAEVRWSFQADRPVVATPGFVVSLEPPGAAARPTGPVVLAGPAAETPPAP